MMATLTGVGYNHKPVLICMSLLAQMSAPCFKCPEDTLLFLQACSLWPSHPWVQWAPGFSQFSQHSLSDR